MKVDVVVDVGNSRIKWGRCANRSVAALAVLPLNEPDAWQRQLADWGLAEREQVWAVSGVQPAGVANLCKWLKHKGHSVKEFWRLQELPISVLVDSPGQVGVDRVLNGIAAKHRAPQPVRKIIIDAGSAVTVDLVDEKGRFRGGAIFPGMRLMGRALHDYTALLPVVEIAAANPPLPGKTTEAAIKAGVFWAVAGGIQALTHHLMAGAENPSHRQLFLTGGDASLIAPVLDSDVCVWPEMTLEGLRLAAEALP
jgi:type III pantothenate kinase